MNKVALVTGGAKGIGEAIVRRLCFDGFSVAVNYSSSELKAKALCEELNSQGFCAVSVKCDVSDASQVKEMFSFVNEQLGSVDVLVNNAGVSLWGLFDLVTDSQWEDTVSVNLKGAFNCSREALPFMVKRKYGRIINISSVWGQCGASCEAVYSATKAGIIGLTKALAKEYALSSITVNCVSPGVIDTDMMSRFTDEEKALIAEDIPMGRMGSPRDVAEAVAFFAGARSGYITGQILGVNGGTV